MSQISPHFVHVKFLKNGDLDAYKSAQARESFYFQPQRINSAADVDYGDIKMPQ